MLIKITPNANKQILEEVVKYFNIHAPKYEVDNYLRVCHFTSQAAHESASFRTLKEFASGAAYEGRKDLGNVKSGDGVRYKGRGIFQLTGRANYRTIGAKLGFDLENNPILAESPEVSVLTALEYWKSRKLNVLADADNVELITRRINGGLNGFEDRKKYLTRCKQIIPKNFSFAAPVELTPPPPVNPLIPPVVVAKKGDISPYIADLQKMLINKGAKITADGNFGPRTEQAVKTFQQNNGLVVSGQIDTDTLNKLMV
jgi:putative chitinase